MENRSICFKMKISRYFSKLLISPQSSIVPYSGMTPKYPEDLFMACGSRLVGDVEVGTGVTIWFNAVVRGDVHWIKIGDNSNVQDSAVIHTTYQKHPTIIGKQVTIGHSAMLHGCTVHDNVIIGLCSIVMDRAVIGSNSIIGAGSLVPEGKEIPEGVLAFGRPAKVVRELTQEEKDFIQMGAEAYKKYVEGYDFNDIVKI